MGSVGRHTFVFTDIESSTERALRLGDQEWSALLRRHHREQRAAIAAHGGREVKDLGDGLMVVFGEPGQGVAFACDVLDRMATVGLAVRIGVHTGEAIPEGEDFIGAQVHVAARIAGAARGGEALISAATVEALGAEASAFRLGVGRRLRLRGMPELQDAFPIGDPITRDPPGDLAPLVGRNEELGLLRRALADAMAGTPVLVLVFGEPGAGKTRLVGDLAAEASALAQVHWGRCWERPGAPEYLPWRRLMASLVETDPSGLAGVSVLGHLAPEVAAVCGPPPPLSADADTARFELFDAVRVLLATRSADSPLVIIFEDMHSADQASLLLLHDVMQGVERAPIMVVATAQSLDTDAVRRLRAVHAGLIEVSLGPLGDEDVATLLSLLARGSVPEETVASIRDATDGNPFLITELALALARGETGAVPGGVQGAIERRVQALGVPAGAIIEMAAVLGKTFELIPLRLACATTGPAMLQHLEEAARRGLVTFHPDRPTGQFVHGIIHRAVYERISPIRRAELHGATGDALASLGRAPAELAWHFTRAAGAGWGDRAVTASRQAGEAARDLQAYGEAVDHFEAAIASLDFAAMPTESDRAELMVDLGEVLVRAGNRDRASAALESAVGAATNIGRADLAARAALAWPPERAAPFWMNRELIDRLLVKVGDGGTSARLYAERCRLGASADDETAGSDADAALRLADDVADVTTTVGVLRRILQAGYPRGQARRQAIDRLDRLASEANFLSGAMAACFYRGQDRIIRGDGDGAAAAFTEQLRRADHLREPLAQVDARLRVAAVHLARAEDAESERLLAEASAIADRLGDRTSRLGTFGLVWVSHHDRRALADLAPLLPSLQAYADLPLTREVIALIALAAGDRRPAERAVADPPTRPYSGGHAYWRTAMYCVLEAAIELGDADAAAELATQFEGDQGFVATAPGSSGVAGVVSHVIGRARLLAGELDGAVHALDETVAMCAALGAPRHEALARADLADALVTRGEPDDLIAARRTLDDAADLHAADSIRGLADRTAALRERLRSDARQQRSANPQ